MQSAHPRALAAPATGKISLSLHTRFFSKSVSTLRSVVLFRRDGDIPRAGHSLISLHPALGEFSGHCPVHSLSLHRHSGPCLTDGLLTNLPFSQRRQVATWIPEAVQSFTIWGGSGFLLKTLHGAYVPYWLCFSVINVMIRIILFPVVIYGAQTAARFAKVVPDVQFLITVFQHDMRKMLADKEPLAKRMLLMRTNLTTLGALYKLHKIHPFAVFLSPLLQLPFFIYLSTDLRKITNGLDPLLAQDLVDASVGWIPDLTEPDPWFALPVLAGVAMYSNVEVAMGKHSLAGPSAGRSHTGILMKDVFQSFAVLMPCFTSQLPSGIQIYVVTSFAFTIVQSAALRDNRFRHLVGLPQLVAPKGLAADDQIEGEIGGRYAKQFIELKKLEAKARELRGDGEVLGKGVLAAGFELSFPGSHRVTSIKGSDKEALIAPAVGSNQLGSHNLKPSPLVPSGPFVHGISAPLWQLEEQKRQREREALSAIREAEQRPSRSPDVDFDLDLIEKANRGEVPKRIQFVQPHSNSMPVLPPLRVPRPKRGSKGKKRR
jgi:membrane protein insertase Oxa1/YidC/SpoIIIJ